MSISRRSIISGAGGAALALVGGGAAWRVTRLPKTAILPWALDPTPPKDIRLDAFRYAILAPNPHNRQPWLITLIGENQALISCDLDKRLPETDPFDRQITIGFGTFLELARIAASRRGTEMEIAPFPDGEPAERLDARPVALLSFKPDTSLTPDPLYGAILARCSNKEVYDLTRAVPDALAAKVAGEDARHTTAPAQIAVLRSNILAALRIEQTTKAKYMESVDLIRLGHEEVDASPDGVDLSGPKMEALKLTGLLSRDSLSDMNSTAWQTGMDQLEETYGSIPAMLWITTPGNTRADQLEAGRRYVRVNLRATALGLSMHPASQALQEYPEMTRCYARAHHLLGASGQERVQMQARIGYGPKIRPAPRWPLKSHLRA